MVIMMNFDEPDLEDLIQHDLHSEMNKILDESGPENSVSHLTACSMPQVIPSNSCSSLTSQFNGSNQLKADAADTQTTVESKSNDIPDLQIVHIGSLKHETSESNTLFVHSAATTSANSEKVQADFSGHFSVERFPTAALDEQQQQQRVGMECLVQKSEQNDLSNLAWLTTVDVQQTLQRDGGIVLPEIDTDLTTVVSSMQQTQTSAGGSLPFPSPASKLPGFQAHPTPAPLNGESLENRIQARFTPIQPHPNPEVPHQRYMLHGGHHAAMRHRNLLPHSERPGPHRFTHHGAHTSFHPYPPPPPYGSSGYGHEPPFHYGRGQGPSQKVYPKPVYSYSCLIAMSLTKSKSGCLPVSDIYSFMMENFPYFKTAPDGWKNSVRHNLSLNKCFEKVEKPNGTQRKGCLWALNPAKVSKMEEEVQKWKRKDPESIRRSMSNPDEFDREMEQLRRADEEAARRRMISMTSHGLSLATPPPHPFHHHPHPHHPHFNPHHMNEATRPHMHPSGSVSMPTTPQHLSPQAGQYRHPMTPVQRSGSTSAYGNNGNNGNQSFAHPPRQLFQFPPDPNALHLGAPDISSTPSSSGKLPSILATPFKALPHLMSPNSSSSTSSGNSASFFGPLADTLSSHDLNDLDLDSSLADLSALQGPFWDETASALTPSGAGDGLLGTDTPFDDPEAPQRGATQQVGESPSSTSSSSANFHVVGPAGGHHSVAGDPSGPGVFPGRFAGELGGYFTGSNNKPVLMH